MTRDPLTGRFGPGAIAPAEERFWQKVTKTDSCWLWTGAKGPNGYGYFGSGNGQSKLAHRFSWESIRAPIPEGAELDHLCRVRACVNPSHLEPVTHTENVRRGLAGSMVTHCKRGHEHNEENTVLHHGWRECRICNNERRRKPGHPAAMKAVRA